MKDENNGTKYVYGGYFGEDVVDPVPDMCMNGVVHPDLSFKPGALEVRNGQSPVLIEYVANPYIGTGSWKIVNHYHVLDLNTILKSAMKLLKMEYSPGKAVWKH